MRDAYIKAMYELSKKNKDILVMVGDIGTFSFDKFRKKFPKRFYNVGIAEANMIGMAAGLALCGKIPFVYTIAPFATMRCFEQIRVDVCCQNLNVKIVGVGGGFSYTSLGPTHHATEDIAIMRSLPNMTIVLPADPIESRKVTEAAIKHKGPVYIRLGKNGEPNIYKGNYDFELGKAITLRKGKDATIIASGSIVNDALTAASDLAKEGIDIRVINMHTVKPLDKEAVLNSAKETNAIVTLEEHNILGGLGGAVAEILAESSEGVPFKRLGLKDTFCEDFGSHEYLKEKYSLSIKDITLTIKQLLSGRRSVHTHAVTI